MATEALKTKPDLVADINALFPDQNDEAITPDFARDHFLDTVHAAFGCSAMLWTTSALAVPSNTGTDAVITGFHASKTFDLTVSAANGTITIPAKADGNYKVEFMASVNPSANIGGMDWIVYKNGVATAIHAVGYGQTLAGAVQLAIANLSAMGRLDLVQGDVLDIRQHNATGVATLNSWIQFSVTDRKAA